MNRTTSCPACNFKAESHFDTCPKCGVIVERYLAKQAERDNREGKKQEQKRLAEAAKLASEIKAAQEAENIEKAKTASLSDRKKCPACAMQIPVEALKCPFCRKTVKTSPIALLIAGGVLLLIFIGMCSTSNQTTSSQTKSAEPISYSRGYVSCLDKINTSTTYATFIGRAVVCGQDIKPPMEYIGAWFDECFEPNERASQLLLFTAGVEMNAENQKNGKSPDTCENVIRVFKGTTWPDNQSQSKHTVQKEAVKPEPYYPPPPKERIPLPITTDKIPYIDKENKQ